MGISVGDREREVDEETIYTGTVKFFDGRKGFGFIIPDEDIEWQGQTASAEDEGDSGVFVAREDIIVEEDTDVRLNFDTKVQFMVFKGKNGLGACQVQNEDGTPYSYKRGMKRKKSEEETGSKKKVKK